MFAHLLHPESSSAFFFYLEGVLCLLVLGLFKNIFNELYQVYSKKKNTILTCIIIAYLYLFGDLQMESHGLHSLCLALFAHRDICEIHPCWFVQQQFTHYSIILLFCTTYSFSSPLLIDKGLFSISRTLVYISFPAKCTHLFQVSRNEIPGSQDMYIFLLSFCY